MSKLNASAPEFILTSNENNCGNNILDDTEIEKSCYNACQNQDEEEYSESFERAFADLEMLRAAYPDEITLYHDQCFTTSTSTNESNHNNFLEQQQPKKFPLIFILTLSKDNASNKFGGGAGATITMEFPKGYPISKSLEVISYRTSSPSIKKEIIEQVVESIKQTAYEALHTYDDDGEGEECGLNCCATAIDCWNTLMEADRHQQEQATQEGQYYQDKMISNQDDNDIHWITSEQTLIDRKSVFQAHLCQVSNEDMVKRAVHKLIQGSTKIQRATHNMFAYRFSEKSLSNNGTTILKHDNDDDGEDGAGSRLAQLLEMREEDGVLILVSRWYGGIHLGPKRFAHITNVARDLLIECHNNGVLSK